MASPTCGDRSGAGAGLLGCPHGLTPVGHPFTSKNGCTAHCASPSLLLSPPTSQSLQLGGGPGGRFLLYEQSVRPTPEGVPAVPSPPALPPRTRHVPPCSESWLCTSDTPGHPLGLPPALYLDTLSVATHAHTAPHHPVKPRALPLGSLSPGMAVSCVPRRGRLAPFR